MKGENTSNNGSLQEWYANKMFALEYSQITNKDLFIENDIKKKADFRLRINKNAIENSVSSN